MKAMRLIILTVFFLSPLRSPATIIQWEKEKAVLKGGANAVFSNVQSLGKKEDFMGGGFNTHFAYRMGEWELDLASYVFFAKMKKLVFSANNVQALSNGNLISFSLAPLLKYRTQMRAMGSWSVYLAAGPVWALQSVELEENQLAGTLARKNKISYNSRGAMLALGMEEVLPYKEMHPVYAEIVYQRMDAYQVSIVDNSNFKQVEVTSKEGTNQHVIGNIIMLAMGITIF